MNTSDISNLTNSGNTVLSALERFFPYWGLKGKALDVYIKEIADSDKPKEIKAFEILNAKQSFRKIKNAKSILDIASTFTTEEKIKNASYSDNEEFFDCFWEKASNISDEKVQVIFGKILANEIENKGSTPKGIFRILSELDSSLANAFNRLCELKLIFILLDKQNSVLRIGTEFVKFNTDTDYYYKKGLSLEIINELEAIGLITTSLGYHKTLSNDVAKVLISDGDSTECLVTINNHELDLGNLMLTKAGIYLSKIIDADCAKDQMCLAKDYYKKHSYSFDESNKIRIARQLNGSVIICNLHD